MRLQQGFAAGGMGSAPSFLRDNNPWDRMSALGQKQTSPYVRAMSALPPKADIAERAYDVRFVPKADIRLGCTYFRLLGGQEVTHCVASISMPP
jgi:hypothetical protein